MGNAPAPTATEEDTAEGQLTVQPMVVIADASPLRYLILIGGIDLLPQLYGGITLPATVQSELTHPQTPQIVREWARNVPSWVNVAAPVAQVPDYELDPGESEAIALAIQSQANLVLMDERCGRQVASSHGLLTTGVLGILQEAERQSLVDLPAMIARLDQTNFRMSEALRRSLLGQHS